MHLDFRQLRNFVALVEQGSFGQAADVVCLSQSAFSRSIQALEQSVGHPLIDRQSKFLQLTPYGHKLLPYARRFQDLTLELKGLLREVDDEQNGELIFGCGPAPTARLIPAAVAEFNRLTPQAKVNFRVDNWNALRIALASGELPFVVADTWHAELDTQLRVQPLRSQRCFFICHRSHPLARREAVTAQELMRYPLAAPYLPPGVRKVLATLSGQADYTPAIQCDHIYALLSILAQSQAISFASEDGFQLCRQSHQLVKLELRDVPDEWRFMQTRFGLISPAQQARTPLVDKMTDIILLTDEQQQWQDEGQGS
ncbi:LysR family transcriptional regulator [Candidatus Pantoea multigeneris]|uniref:LysR family transcriptional regulator n=1 Tax=Candidatus Pantoea multigeneris TaxID=2608357 RepID=A0ABX0RAL9_9GAMM|nr:LysR family transcriptional regulator [Pantoea multigeneris]NIF21168.1 LysR family transcriptional regulator [Pantoea multigeneris]